MTFRPDEAAVMLADVETVVARVKQSRIYRTASDLLILWGALIACGDLARAFAPAFSVSSWLTIDALGLAATIVRLMRIRGAPRLGAARFGAAFALFAVFGFLWSVAIGRFGPRELDVFWPTLFLFGYALAGLWFGVAFTAIGLGLTLLIAAGYFWAGEAFPLFLALVDGGGMMACGFAMRRA